MEQRQQAKKASWEYITAYVRQAEGMTSTNTQLDLFGNDTSWKEEAEKVAKYTAKARAQIKDRLNLLRSSQRVEKRQDIAKELGVEIKTPEEASQLIGKLMRLDAAYEHLDPALGISSKAQAWDGKSAVVVDLSVLEGGASFSIDANEWKREKIEEILKTEEGRKFKRYVDYVLKDKDTSGIKNLRLRELTLEEVEDYSNLLGVDLTGASVEFMGSRFIHIKNKHGDDSGNNKEENQRDFTYEDLLLLPYILKKGTASD